MVHTLVREKGGSHLARTQAPVEEEVPEILVGAETDAIAYPGAVVVHAHHAPAANRAVVRAWRLYLLAFLTISESDVVVSLSDELGVDVLLALHNDFVVRHHKWVLLFVVTLDGHFVIFHIRIRLNAVPKHLPNFFTLCILLLLFVFRVSRALFHLCHRE